VTTDEKRKLSMQIMSAAHILDPELEEFGLVIPVKEKEDKWLERRFFSPNYQLTKKFSRLLEKFDDLEKCIEKAVGKSILIQMKKIEYFDLYLHRLVQIYVDDGLVYLGKKGLIEVVGAEVGEHDH